ncbi:A-kinase anchor protein 14 isoform X1 [Centrocercus urophasianus]|uniref:A-kinase anchor protein 14 isoform X1 n=1 Tax=Centrocercus urophasianus TaxID=9002 RepID=UPI001C64BC18|nr:A-kinase anchor protein 14 isoform X1 [Centrocercus urophasianus]
MDNENESAATEKVARTIVKKAIHTAQEYYLNNVQEEEGKELALFATSYRVSELSQKDFHSILSFSEAEYAVRNIQWTTCEDFSVERGQQQIEEYISQTWELHKSWLHCSEFLWEEDLQYSKKYHYRVLWSIPTRRKPIPLATASTYFVIEISKIKPATLPVEVFFFLESSRLIHRPEHCRFREKWLKDIIENKIILRERLKLP